MHSRSRGRLSFLACSSLVLAGWVVLAQSRSADEATRERWQRVDEILAAMAVVPGAVVADVGAGDGFFTSRLSRAVGPTGRVFAVDIDRQALAKLRKRLADERLENVTVIESARDDPKLPERVLDAALIINAYHEMREHQAILAGLARALKPDGRLVIVEPVSSTRRGKSRAEQARNHEIDPEYVMGDARAAGFRIVNLQDPFTSREHDIEWLITIQPSSGAPLGSTAPAVETAPRPEDDPALRVSIDAFQKLVAGNAVTIVDVRTTESFEQGRIPAAVSIPLDEIETNAEPLRRLGKPIVTYCS